MYNLKIDRIIEALLFSNPKPLDQKMIDKIFPNEKINLSEIIIQLNEKYNNEDHAFEISMIAGGYQLISKKEYEYYIKLILDNTSKFKPSKPALDTLAIIAYKQPVSRNEIESIRGVDSSGVLKTLLTNDLIKISGRSNSPGKPLLYKTTKKFLEFFGLNDLTELPKLKEIKQLIESDIILGEQIAVFNNS